MYVEFLDAASLCNRNGHPPVLLHEEPIKVERIAQAMSGI
jgi:hypothetical protein